MSEERFDVIVVGAGLGGATCAGLLAKRGLRVLLLDKNSRAGGKAMVISKNGFTYELWPVIHAPSRESRCKTVLRELGLEDRVELLEPQVRGAIYLDPAGKARRFPDDPEPDPTKVFDVLGIRPEEHEEAVRVLADLTLMPVSELPGLDEVSFEQWLNGYRTPSPLRTYLNAICNGVFMVPSDMLAASEAIRTLREILLQGGGLYCRSGGIGQLAEVFSSAVEANGGSVKMRTRVHRIRVEEGRVTGVETENGTFSAPIVISNAGIQPTVLRLVGETHFDRGYVNYVKDLAPSWGMMGVRYFLDEPRLDEPFYMVFSDEGHWTTDRWLRAQAGDTPREVILWIQVPSANDSSLAPPGRQCVLTGTWCSPDPQAPREENERWWSKIDEMMERVWPGFMDHVQSREPYDTHDVSALSRDPTLPGVGGECIGIAQVIGQCGRHKPPMHAPIRGLFLVGTDAGGYGCGTHQAVDSGMNVADEVFRYSALRRATLAWPTSRQPVRSHGTSTTAVE
jgi:prolycopene isomerase